MKEQFATYEISLKLKELGFDEKCDAVYNPIFLIDGCWETKNSTIIRINKSCKKSHDVICAAPLYQQVIDWLREKHNIHITIHGDNFNSLYEFTGYGFQIFKTKWNVSSENIILYSSPSLEEFTYNNAREQAILKALTLIS